MPKTKQTQFSTGPKRSTDEILRDRAETAKLRLEGKTQGEIAQWLIERRPYRLSQQTIANDLKVVREQWLNTSVENYEKTAMIELARIDEEEAIVLDAWKKSTEPKIRKKERTRTGTNDGKMFEEFIQETDEESRDGNPAFLQRLESVRQRRCEILGFTAQQRSNDINAAIDTLVREEYTIGLPPELGEDG